MALTYPYAGGWNQSFAAVSTVSSSAAVPVSPDVGSGANRRALAIVTYRGGSPTFPVPSAFDVGSDSIPAFGSVFTESTGNKWQVFASTTDLTVSGAQVCTGTFTGGGGGPSGVASVALLIVKGDAALTIANILALLEQAVGGGGGSNSRAVASSAGQTVIRMALRYGGAGGSADAPATLIASSTAGTFFEKDIAAGASTVLSMTWGAFAETVGFGFTVSEAGAAPILTGNITADDATATGSLATLPPSSLTGNITAADAAPTGSLGQQLASLTTLPFTRNPGNGGRVVSIANVALAVLTDDVNLTRLVGSTGLLMGVDGRLSLANQVPAPPGTTVVVVTREPDGKLGVERYALT